MIVKAIKNTSTHCKGCIYDLTDEEAKALIDANLAIEYKEPTGKKSRK